jgi:putative ABC transport system permease protein
MSLFGTHFGTVSRGVRNIARNPVRLVLVVALLGTSLMLASAMFALNASAQQRLTSARTQIGTGIDIRSAGSFSTVGKPSELSQAQLRQAEQVPGVVSATEAYQRSYKHTDIKGSIQGGYTPANGDAQTAPSNGTIEPFIYGFSPGLAHYQLFGGGLTSIVVGRTLTTQDTEAALVSQALANANSWKLGSTFSLEGTRLTIVGLFTSGNQFSDNAILIPIQTARQIYQFTGASTLTVYTANADMVPQVVNELKRALGTAVDVLPQIDQFSASLNALQTAQETIFGALIASLVTSALVIVFAVVLIVRERRQEIGLLKALGASHGQVIGQFAAEILSLALVAALAALAGLLTLGSFLAQKFDVTVPPPEDTGGPIHLLNPGNPLQSAHQTPSVGLTPGTLVVILLLGMGLAVLTSAIPAWYVARIKPAQVLRAE